MKSSGLQLQFTWVDDESLSSLDHYAITFGLENATCPTCFCQCMRHQIRTRVKSIKQHGGVRRVFCSRTCAKLYQSRLLRGHKKTWTQYACNVCGDAIAGTKNKLCLKCFAISKGLVDEKCPACNKSLARSRIAGKGPDRRFVFCNRECRDKYHIGANHPAWLSGRIIDTCGYVRTRVNGRYKAEHRQVMEAHLGRPLTKFETVHHVDGNRRNNALENLELWSHNHGKGQRSNDLAEIFMSRLVAENPRCIVSTSQLAGGVYGDIEILNVDTSLEITLKNPYSMAV